MTTVKPVLLTTGDGVEREIRFTLGARKRMAERFGTESLQEILNRLGDGAVSGLVYCCMYDRDGKPPAGLAEEAFAEMLPGNASGELLATFFSAVTQGEVPKNVIEARITAALRESIIGSGSGASEPSASDLPPPISGMVLPSPSSAPEPIDTGSGNDLPTIEPDLSPPPSTT